MRDSAGWSALYLISCDSSATLTVRASSLETAMSDHLVQLIRGSSNVEVPLESEVLAAQGGERMTAPVIRSRTLGIETRALSPLLDLIGAE